MMERAIYVQRGRTDQFEFIDNQFQGISAKDSSRIMVSVLEDGHLGIAQGTRFSNVDTLAQEARKLCPFSRKVEYRFPSAGQSQYGPCNRDTPNLSDDEIIDFGHRMIEGAVKRYPEVTVDVIARRSSLEMRYENSHGVVHEGQENMLTYTINVQRSNEEDLFSEYKRFDHTVHQPAGAQELETYLDEIEHHFPIVQLWSGTFPAILLASNLEPFLTGLWQALDGKRLYENQSILKDKFGQKIFDERVHISIDPLVQGVGKFDFEGVEAEELVLVEQGILKKAFYDLEYGQKTGEKPCGLSTGNPRARFQTYPLRMAWGVKPLADLRQEVSRGIIITDCHEVARTTNLKGDFSCGVDALYFDHGHVLGRVKNLNVSGNLFTALNSGFAEASSDGRNSPVLGAMAPHILLQGLQFTV